MTFQRQTDDDGSVIKEQCETMTSNLPGRLTEYEI